MLIPSAAVLIILKSMEKYDLAVIGSWPGGYLAAIRVAQLGMKVTTVIERDKPGGVRLNWAASTQMHRGVRVFQEI